MALLRTRSGTTALEFAIIAPVYFLVLLATLEMLFSFYLQNVLDLVVYNTARAISTGSVQLALDTTATSSVPTSETQLINQSICPANYGVLICSALAVNVYPVTSGSPVNYYNSTTGQLPVSGNVVNTSGWSVETCSAGVAMYIQVFYQAPSWLGKFLPNWTVLNSSGASVHPLMASGGFVNELFTSTVTGGQC